MGVLVTGTRTLFSKFKRKGNCHRIVDTLQNFRESWRGSHTARQHTPAPPPHAAFIALVASLANSRVLSPHTRPSWLGLCVHLLPGLRLGVSASGTPPCSCRIASSPTCHPCTSLLPAHRSRTPRPGSRLIRTGHRLTMPSACSAVWGCPPGQLDGVAFASWKPSPRRAQEHTQSRERAARDPLGPASTRRLTPSLWDLGEREKPRTAGAPGPQPRPVSPPWAAP